VQPVGAGNETTFEALNSNFVQMNRWNWFLEIGLVLWAGKVALHQREDFILLLSMLSQIDAVGRLFGWKPESQQAKLWVPIRNMIPRVMTWRQPS
jgi:hypothetical protein